MQVVPLSKQTEDYNIQAAKLLEKVFPQSYADCAEEEMDRCLESERIALAMVEGEALLGFVGAIPQYGVTAWELHPLVVDDKHRRRGIGTQLCAALENALKARGCLTIYLGSDDENFSTSLSNTNLFENTFEKIAAIKNLKNHPFEFYQKLGYQIVGVVPDANGIGKPDIWLAKSLYYTAKQLGSENTFKGSLLTEGGREK